MARLALAPVASAKKYHFGTFPPEALMALAGYVAYFAAIVKEEEGITAVFEEAAKESLKLYSQKDFMGPFCLIAFSATTGLNETGITAAASKALAKEGIPANFMSGFYHDCVLVPFKSKEKALSVLSKL